MNEKPLFRRPAIFNQFHELIAGESTRHGGVSEVPYNSLNLGGSTTDEPENVTENNLRFFSGLGINVADTAKSHQIHGAEILHVEQPGRYEGYDALITSKAGIQLAVTIADCTPILIYDPIKKAVAAIHAGWRGTVQNIVSKTIEDMKVKFGTEPGDCFGYVGTCIDECSFEVGEEVALHFESVHKRWDEKKHKYFVDLKKANKDQLLSCGLNPEHVEVSDFSTVLNNEDYFSYRLENGKTGRMLATIGINKL
ncbi:peptidoglycan editing factor PgeF [Dyadobacter psychrotolerans]|uniref:Purine nucleoside phosphorylase n=1 Tax=Dyadobacter psychrotolerans TaxID=2541721 RepID=A0A4R5E0N7_9BACT|nr:peptidoglycan editing factor PgeF [Dyadobacter psychrotolerans]TDE18614.1 peptidoglycan editing factor PgeF [Dyadobacter psychrotolerans]